MNEKFVELLNHLDEAVHSLEGMDITVLDNDEREIIIQRLVKMISALAKYKH